MIDAALGYNLLWFYPIVALFKIVGPSYTALRLYFFSLATCTGLLAFAVVNMATRRRYLALLAGILALLLPGQLFRNYMAFVVLLNMALFLKTFLLPYASEWRRLSWMAITAGALGLTFLIRIDLGFFLSALFLGLMLLSPLMTYRLQKKQTSSLQERFLLALLGLLLAITIMTAVHLPFYNDAVARGFGRPFLEQYEQFLKRVIIKKNNFLQTLNPKEILEQQKEAAPKATPAVPPSIRQTAIPTTTRETTLARRSVFHAHKMRERLMALNLYLPIPLSLLFLFMAGMFFFSKKSGEDDPAYFQSFALLICLGCTATLFPQYFFWRPDMVHLGEFMVPMTTTTLIATSFSLDASKKTTSLKRFFFLFVALTSVTTVLFYLDDACQSQSTGGIAISQKRTVPFVGKNGVNVLLTPPEFENTSAIYQSVMSHTKAGEYVICYPYNPEINFMTDRPSYRHNLYIDDLTAPHDFEAASIEEIKKYQPAAIIITDWPINGTEHSRFTHWAPSLYEYIRRHYVADYEKEIIHVFVKPAPQL